MARCNTSILTLFFVATALLLAGCERKPEDVETWRNAERGMEKMREWATDPSEPMDVRVRAMQVIIEENNPTLIDPTLEEVEDEEAKSKLVDGAVETVLELWKKGEPPTIDKEAKEQGGRVKISPGDPATVAKDSAYYLIPHANGSNEEKLRGILVEWLSSSWRVRDEAGKTNLGQLLPRAGRKGLENALQWLEKTDDVFKVASTLRKQATDEQKKEIATIIKKRAEEAHPDLSEGLLAAVVNTEHELIVSYLKKAVADPKSSPKMVDQCMETVKKIQGPKATEYFSKLIRENPGTLRWAAVNDLVKIRGKAGILTAAKSLPLDKEQYEKEAESGKTFAENARWFGRFTVGEMINSDVSSISTILIRALESEGWPVQVLGLATTSRAVTCATKPKECGEGDQGKKQTQDLLGEDWGDVHEAIENLSSSRETIPAWGEDKTVGELAESVAGAMDEAERD